VVENLGIKDVIVRGYARHIGILAGENEGIIRNCRTTHCTLSTVWSPDSDPRGTAAGGLAGYNTGHIGDCYADNIDLTSSVSKIVGGFVAHNKGTVIRSYATPIFSPKSPNSRCGRHDRVERRNDREFLFHNQ